MTTTTTTKPASTKTATNAKNSPAKGEQRRAKPKGKAAKSGSDSTDRQNADNTSADKHHGKGTKDSSRSKDVHKRKQSPAVSVPSLNEPDDGSKFSGSTFYLSPNAASLPRPPFKGKNGASPPLGGANTTTARSGTPVMHSMPQAPPPPAMMYRPAPQYGVPYGAFPGYPSGAYPPVMHTPMGVIPPNGVPGYVGPMGPANPIGPIAGYPPMVMNAPPRSHAPS